MFDDILDEKEFTKEDLKAKVDELAEVLRECRDEIVDNRKSIDVLKNQFVDTFNDAKRFSEHIKKIHDKIQAEGLEHIFQDLGMPE